jgi:hypothetical protein
MKPKNGQGVQEKNPKEHKQRAQEKKKAPLAPCSQLGGSKPQVLHGLPIGLSPLSESHE